MKYHGTVYLFSYKNILFYKLNGATNLETVLMVQDHSKKFIEVQDGPFYLVYDLSEWDFAPIDTIDYIRKAQYYNLVSGRQKLFLKMKDNTKDFTINVYLADKKIIETADYYQTDEELFDKLSALDLDWRTFKEIYDDFYRTYKNGSNKYLLKPEDYNAN